jgi:hypothetical protein
MQKIHEEEMMPLNDLEMKRLGIDVIEYNDLRWHTKIPVIVLFLTVSKSSGHWFCILKHKGKIIEVFDSYGTEPDGWFHWITKKQQQNLGQETHYLASLLEKYKNKGYTIIYNTKQFQKDKMQDCGRHVLARLLNKHLTLDQYNEKILKSGLSPDDYVTKITDKYIFNK